MPEEFFLEQFKKEVLFMQSLNHKNVLRIVDFGTNEKFIRPKKSK